MANTGYSAGSAKPLTKEEIRARQQRAAIKERKKILAQRQAVAISNSRDRDVARFTDRDADEILDSNEPIMDKQIVADIQKMKFCRKPVGFLMSLVMLICIAVVAIPFVGMKVDLDTMSSGMISQYTALFNESEVAAANTDNTDNTDNTEGTTPETAANAEGETTTDTTTDTTADATATATTTYYSLSDPVLGWVKYIGGLVGLDLDFGSSDWYDAQISKTETGMTDTIAPILIKAFPVAIILYIIFALALFIKTMVCWLSNDRRIYRHTGIECLIMILLAAIVAFGGFATTVEINETMAFGGIANFFIGTITKTGGFTVGFGLLIMIALPLVAMILSWFLLEKKLRSREIMQPVIVYDYKRNQGRN